MPCDQWCGTSFEKAKRAVIRQAKRIGSKALPPKTASEVIEDTLARLYDETIAPIFLNGRTILTTSEASGSITFNTPEGLGPLSVMAFLEEILEDLDPTAGPRTIKRLRVCFNVAAI